MLTDLRNTFAQEQSVAGSPGTALVGDEALVGGAVSAWLALDVPHWLALPEST